MSPQSILRQQEFYPGEGHELIVRTNNAEGLVSRQVSKFFTGTNENKVFNVKLPKAIDSTPSLALQNVEDLQRIVSVFDKPGK